VTGSSSIRDRYDPGMTKKIAVSLPDHLVSEAREAVDRGDAASVSAYVAAAMQSYGRRDSLASLLDDLDAEFGEADPEVTSWARQALGLGDR
jgi:Arc/MetJ-type ribon-helix-helix transcriptional regulator